MPKPKSITTPTTKSPKGNGTSATKPAKAKPVAPAEETRKVVHDKFYAETHVGDDAITEEQMKTILGWKEVETNDHVGIVPEIKKLLGKNVVLEKNRCNRPIYVTQLLSIKQDILNNHYERNGDSIVITEYDNVFSGQHRGIAFILACIEWAGKNSAHWQAIRPQVPTLETVVTYGVKETEEVFRTLNSAVASTFADVVYRSEHLANVAATKRKPMAKATEWAMRLLWDRTGAKDQPFSKQRTNSELGEGLNRHTRLIEAVKHVYEEGGATTNDQGIKRFIGLGTAAGVMYLMAASHTDDETYRDGPAVTDWSEERISFKHWNKARDFWTAIAKEKGSGPMKEVRNSIDFITSVDKRWGDNELRRKLAVLAKAWDLYKEGKPLTKSSMEIPLDKDADDIYTLRDTYSFGGIDVGTNKPKAGSSKSEEQTTDEAEVDRKKKVAELLAKRAADKSTKPGKPAANGTPTRKAPEQAQLPAITSGGALQNELQQLKAKHPDTILIFKGIKDKDYRAWGDDAYTIARLLSMQATKGPDGMARLTIGEHQFAKGAPKLLEQGKVALCRYEGDKTIVTPYTLPTESAAK